VNLSAVEILNLITGSSFRCPTLTLGLLHYLQNAALEVAETFAVPLSCHFLLPREGKSLTRKGRDAGANLASKYSEPTLPRSRCGLRDATEDIFVQRPIL
jgi:hypothetical protein